MRTGMVFDIKEELRLRLARQGPKVGDRNTLADEMVVFLFDALAEACEKQMDNGRGGIVRPGQDPPCITSGWRAGMRACANLWWAPQRMAPTGAISSAQTWPLPRVSA
jgi:hypothetical protein